MRLPLIWLALSQGFRSPSSASLSGDVVQQVDARYPALLFKQQLTTYVETIYGIVQENVKRELASVLSSCIQVDSSMVSCKIYQNFRIMISAR